MVTKLWMNLWLNYFIIIWIGAIFWDEQSTFGMNLIHCISPLDFLSINEVQVIICMWYTNYSNCLCVESSVEFGNVSFSFCRLPSIKQQVQQYKLLYIGLYLLIWGEAANLRLMPECLCYVFHYVMCHLIHCIALSTLFILLYLIFLYLF